MQYEFDMMNFINMVRLQDYWMQMQFQERLQYYILLPQQHQIFSNITCIRID